MKKIVSTKTSEITIGEITKSNQETPAIMFKLKHSMAIHILHYGRSVNGGVFMYYFLPLLAPSFSNIMYSEPTLEDCLREASSEQDLYIIDSFDDLKTLYAS